MADSLPTAAQQALVWQSYGSDATNLVCPIVCDFTTYSQYTFNPQGNFRQAGTVFAAGLVVDNLLNSGPLFVMIGPITETIPPYTKTSLTLAGSATQVTIAGTQAKIIVTFYRGAYLGTTSGTNYYAAQIAAGLAVETGFVSMFAGSTAAIPVGYLLCDGAEISRTTYAGLYAVIGTLYGPGNGSTTFNLPDFRGRMAVGAGTGPNLTTRALAAQGGQEQVTLTAQQIAVHTHPVTDNGHTHPMTDPGHAHGVTDTLHNHFVTDNGHVHPFQSYNTDGSALLTDTTMKIQDVNQSRFGFNTTNSPANGYFIGHPTSRDSNVSAIYNYGIKTAMTGVTNQASGSGITVNSGKTGITAQTVTTGITIGNAGGQGGTTQPTPTMPPYTGLNFVIKT